MNDINTIVANQANATSKVQTLQSDLNITVELVKKANLVHARRLATLAKKFARIQSQLRAEGVDVQGTFDSLIGE